MTNHISNTVNKTSTFSAPVVQSRLEHHHLQQLKHPEARQQLHNRSKSLNRGKRGFSHNLHHQIRETSVTASSASSSNTTTTDIGTYPRNTNVNNKCFSNRVDHFDSHHHRDPKNIDSLVENGSNAQLQRKTSNSSRPSRRHQHSDSVDEDKSRVTHISILKRPQSATDFVKPSKTTMSSLDVAQTNNRNGEKSQSSRRRSDVTPSKAKRAQRRKEIKSMTLELAETDLLLSGSPPQPITIQQLSGSSDESDVNSNNKCMKSVSSSTCNDNNGVCLSGSPSQTNNAAVIFPPLNYSNAILALEEGMNSNKREDTSNSDDNILVKSSFERPISKEYKRFSDHYVDYTPRRRLSSTAIELQSQVSHFSDSDSMTLPSESILSSTPPSARRPSSSPSRLGGIPKLYAGPTFHNSPAPSDLPMPSFYSKSLGKDSSPLSVGGNNLFTVPENMPSPPRVHESYSSPSSGNTSDDDIFAMDDFEPSNVPHYPEKTTLRKQKSQELLRILAGANARQHQTATAYMVPERMATAHHPMNVYPTNNGLNLNEISETLRSLLKIHGQ